MNRRMTTKPQALVLALAVAIVVPWLAGAGEAPAQEDPHAAHQAALAAGDSGERQLGERLDHLEIPDVPVIDQDGHQRRFFTDLVEGKTVAMNFVFTTCTTICPPMGANFGRLQRELGERVGDEVHLISVSVDPATDTPERMRSWGQNFGAAEGWTLVTGERSEITRLLKALEVFTPDVTEHSPVVLLGNEPDAEWTRAYGLAPPAKLAEILTGLGSSAAGHAAAGHAGHDHAMHGGEEGGGR